MRATTCTGLLAAAFALGDCASSAPGRPAGPPASAAAALLAADRAFAATARSRDVIPALSAAFADDVVMAAPGGRMAVGRVEVTAALEANPANAGARLAWDPIRVGISADGTHGFTYGYATLTRPGGEQLPQKYLAYWVRGAAGWRVSAYRRVTSRAAPAERAALPPILPPRMDAVGPAEATVRFAAEIDSAERAFSAEAQGGLAAAFRRFGAADAMNMGGPDDATFRFGPDSIAAGVGDTAPGTTITWAPTMVRAASSGDLGVSIGIITITAAATDTSAARSRGIPFFTVWRRASPRDPWRYIAE